MATYLPQNASHPVREINTETIRQKDAHIFAQRAHLLIIQRGTASISVPLAIMERLLIILARELVQLAIMPSFGPVYAGLIAWKNGIGMPIILRPDA